MNRALELAEIFERVLSYGGADSRIADLWQGEFRVEQDSFDFMLAIGCIEQKLSILQDEIQDSELGDRAKGLYGQALVSLRSFVTYRQIFSQKKSQLMAMQSQIDLLFLAAENLPNHMVPEINPVTIEVLENDVSSLMDQVRAAELDSAFRSMLLTSLGTLLLSIQAYSTLGPDGASKLYGAAAAEIARLSGTTLGKKPENSSFASKAVQICKKTGAAIIFVGAVVSGAHSAIEDGSEILGIADHSEKPHASTTGH